jgi:hypothetical protein
MRCHFIVASLIVLSELVSPAVLGQITGRVTLDAPPPKVCGWQGLVIGPGVAIKATGVDLTWVVGTHREVANVVVYLDSEQPARLQKLAPPTRPSVNAANNAFDPHVVGVMAGKEIKFTNGEAFLQRLHSGSVSNPVFNFGLRPGGEKVIKFDLPEMIPYHSEFFKWETGWICCISHPFFAVTGADGRFAINPAPVDGEYTIVVWHESGQTQRKPITIKQSKAMIDFVMSAPSAARPEASATRPAER